MLYTEFGFKFKKNFPFSLVIAYASMAFVPWFIAKTFAISSGALLLSCTIPSKRMDWAKEKVLVKRLKLKLEVVEEIRTSFVVK